MHKVIKEVSVLLKTATGNTKHYVGGTLNPPFAKLQIAQYDNDLGYYLFYLDASGDIITDTWHSSLEEAEDQAAWEYEIVPDDWITFV